MNTDTPTLGYYCRYCKNISFHPEDSACPECPTCMEEEGELHCPDCYTPVLTEDYIKLMIMALDRISDQRCKPAQAIALAIAVLDGDISWLEFRKTFLGFK